MIKSLNIQNFKSIKHLQLDCKKVNIFIGKPNTGKSNILESIGLFSLPYAKLEDLVRFDEDISNLFYDQDLGNKIAVSSEGILFELGFQNGTFVGRGKMTAGDMIIFQFDFNFDYTGKGSITTVGTYLFKYYKFQVVHDFASRESFFLRPPKGDNLLSLLQTNKALKELIKDIFSVFRLRIGFRPKERKMEVVKEIGDIIISYPYSLVSDTLQRIVFHLAAIETNKDSILIFEEPEAHAFPYYTKFLAERIALDKTNQYFISTHNPYFLLPVLAKAPKEDISIFITYFEDYQTKVRLLTEKEMSETLDRDESIFFNLDEFTEKE